MPMSLVRKAHVPLAVCVCMTLCSCSAISIYDSLLVEQATAQLSPQATATAQPVETADKVAAAIADEHAPGRTFLQPFVPTDADSATREAVTEGFTSAQTLPRTELHHTTASLVADKSHSVSGVDRATTDRQDDYGQVVMEIKEQSSGPEVSRITRDLLQLYSDYAAERGLKVVETTPADAGSARIMLSVVNNSTPDESLPVTAAKTPAAPIPGSPVSGVQPVGGSEVPCEPPVATYSVAPQSADQSLGYAAVELNTPAGGSAEVPAPQFDDCLSAAPDATEFSSMAVETCVTTDDWSVQMAGPTLWARKYPDEYLVNGCDRGYPVHYEGQLRRGLDSQDAIAEYVDHRGRRHTQAANCVAVYAPRFGTVRTATSADSGYSVDSPDAMQKEEAGFRVHARVVPVHHRLASPAVNLQSRRRVSGLDADVGDHNLSSVQRLGQQAKYQGAFQNLAFVSHGRFHRSEYEQLMVGMLAAQVWTHTDFPIITGSVAGAMEVSARFRPQEHVGIDSKHGGPLRITKLADRKLAQQGEEIEFTIRYDNTGGTDLYEIRIVDNLTPRLEYVRDSAMSDLAGNLTVEDNGEGSLVLRFDLDDPLPGFTGGVISFRARVR